MADARLGEQEREHVGGSEMRSFRIDRAVAAGRCEEKSRES